MTYGTVKVASVNSDAVTTSQTSTSNRYYGVQMDKNGKLYVNIPWTDTISAGVPSCSTRDNEKCLMVVNGVASWRGSGHSHTVRTLYYDSDGVVYTSQDANKTRTALTLTAQSNNCY